jgi:two-component system response regulator MprA
MQLPQRDVVVELRNCPCGSSLSVELDSSGEAIARIGLAVAAAKSTVPAGRETLFVVDLDPHVRRLLQQFVRDAYAVEFFDDGYSALDTARRCPPAALVTEILIPRLDGLALCRLLKADPITESVPILVLSILAANDRARRAGADAFLEKPLDKVRVVASLRGLTAPMARAVAPSLQILGAP